MSCFSFVPSCLRGRKKFTSHNASSQSGNILFYILMAIVLIGALTIALRDTGGMDSNIDKESASVTATQIIKYGGEVAQGVNTLIQNGVSEQDIRFAYPSAHSSYGTITSTPQNQVFSSQGANVPFRSPPAGAVTTTTNYGFNGGRSMPQVGSDKADLTMTLGYVTDSVCTSINRQNGISGIPVAPTCGSPTAFGILAQYATSPVAIPASSFTNLPVLQACVYCTDRSMNIYFYTLLAR